MFSGSWYGQTENEQKTTSCGQFTSKPNDLESDSLGLGLLFNEIRLVNPNWTVVLKFDGVWKWGAQLLNWNQFH